MSPSPSYGTVTVVPQDQNQEQQQQEQQPLLTKTPRPWRWSRTRSHMLVNVNRDWADVVLLLCYIITGLLDSSSISIWGSFVSMQTGNTVYIGLGLAAPSENTRWIKSGTSLVSFCLGSFFFSRFHRSFSPARRWVLCASFAMQTLLITCAALILTFGPGSKIAAGGGGGGKNEDISWNVLVPIALIAFQSCGQAVASRALRYNALTSVVLTSNYCDLFSDPLLFAPLTSNAERNRRVAAPSLLLMGAIGGGVFARSSSLGIAGALWTAVGLKLVAVVSWFLWPAEPTVEESD